MAYAYATAVRGYGSFQPLVLDLMFGRTNYFRHFVGGEPVAPPAVEDEVHRLVARRGPSVTCSYVVVKIRLFSFLETPIFEVVVGEVG
jgi:hypothetical protein